MRDYDWFWRVEPGAHFDYHIKFDVFRFMRDHSIDYGFAESSLDWLNLGPLATHIRSFIDHNSHLLHHDAKIAYLGAQGSTGARERERSGADARMRALFEADDQVDDKDETWYLAEAFSAWLVKICGSTLHPNFELGSLAFLRSPSHQALMDHFSEAPNTPIDDVPVHSLSASMFLPKQSVWNFRRSLKYADRATPTPAPDHGIDNEIIVFNWDSIIKDVMRPFHEHWDLIAADFARHEKGPKTNLGHTAIDERNFLMTAPNGRYVKPEECLSCLLAIAGGEAQGKAQGEDT